MFLENVTNDRAAAMQQIPALRHLSCWQFVWTYLFSTSPLFSALTHTHTHNWNLHVLRGIRLFSRLRCNTPAFRVSPKPYRVSDFNGSSIRCCCCCCCWLFSIPQPVISGVSLSLIRCKSTRNDQALLSSKSILYVHEALNGDGSRFILLFWWLGQCWPGSSSRLRIKYVSGRGKWFDEAMSTINIFRDVISHIHWKEGRDFLNTFEMMTNGAQTWLLSFVVDVPLIVAACGPAGRAALRCHPQPVANSDESPRKMTSVS